MILRVGEGRTRSTLDPPKASGPSQRGTCALPDGPCRYDRPASAEGNAERRMTKMPLPSNVPPSRVVDCDIFDPVGLDRGFHETWLSLHRSNPASILWTHRNGGHWIVNDAGLVEKFY